MTEYYDARRDTLPGALSAAVVETAAALDRAWFNAHPKRRAYMRRYLRGEYPVDLAAEMPPTHEVWVIVARVQDGRVRTAVGLPRGPGVPRWAEDDMRAAFPHEFQKMLT